MSQIRPSTKPHLFKRSKNKAPTEKKVEKIKVQKIVKAPVKEQPVKKIESPKISRFIPEIPHLPKPNLSKLRLKWGIVGILIVSSIFLDYLAGTALYKTYIAWSRLMQERQKLSEQMVLWENIAKQYPNYRDAYVEGEIYAYRLGDKAKEQYFLQNLQLLDPNFPLTKTFQELINVQNTVGN